MLSLLRVRAFPLLRLTPPGPGRLSASLRAPLPAFYSTAPATSTRKHFYRLCMNCRREGHITKDCKEPTICVACGVEGHQRGACPNPDPARLEALKTAPHKCFRCGELGHVLKDCTQPPKCFHCAQPGHILKNCPTAPPRTTKAPAATAAV